MSADSSSSDDQAKSSGSLMNVFIATDCHLGYEIKTKRAQDRDSFVTFEEILKLAIKYDADFILLGGDLFHDSKPSQRVILECFKLLKKYCMGERQIGLKFLTKPDLVFPHTDSKEMNYESSNMNIRMPIMTIHGNHDNPSFEFTGTLDVLAASGLINYFGKWNSLKEIRVTPMVFEKDGVNVAIYGLGYVGEQRLSRLIKAGQVVFQRPENYAECFNILVIHQNRARHSENDYIADESLPSWFDFVLWGHEHECRIEPELVSAGEKNYFICQPGSSVATSLCEGESVEKHVGLLSINSDREFRLKKIKLQTVRPFVMDTLTISELISKNYCEPTKDGIYEYVDDYIGNTMLPLAEEQLTGDPDQPKEPLIRLRIFYGDDSQIFDSSSICNKYCDRVANPKDILLFRKERKGKAVKEEVEDRDTEELSECLRKQDDDQNWTKDVQGGIKKIYSDRGFKMNVLSIAGLNEALDRCVEANDDDAFDGIFQHQVSKFTEYMSNLDIDFTKDSIREQIKVYQEQMRAAGRTEEEEKQEAQKLLNDPTQRTQLRQQALSQAADFGIGDDDVPVPATRGRGRGSRGGRARGATRARGRGAAAAKNPLDITMTSPVSQAAPITPAARKKQNTIDLFCRTTDSQSSFSTRTASQASRKTKAPTFIDSSDSD